jgi:serine/threonine protein kinase
MPSSSLADYELGDVIGVGTVGTIYLGVHRADGTRVAIKKLHASVCKDPLIRARFQREMSVLERLRHKNIVGYHGGGRDDNTLYYVMEVVDGGTVKEILEATGALPWPAVVELGIQICSALQWAHNHGVIHRDLKPGNLFLTRQAELKLGDFGIARDLTRSNLTAEGFTVGTHAYMAPEQIRGESSISGKVDLYALGCCLFEMLTARKPFQGENYAQLFDQHIKHPPPAVRDLCPDCPEELSKLIQQLLGKDASDRPFNARQVQAALLKMQESAPQTGHAILIERIKTVTTPVTREKVGLVKLAIIFGTLIAVVAAAAILSR